MDDPIRNTLAGPRWTAQAPPPRAPHWGTAAAQAAERRRTDAVLAHLLDSSREFCRICGEAICEEQLALVPPSRFCRSCAG